MTCEEINALIAERDHLQRQIGWLASALMFTTGYEQSLLEIIDEAAKATSQ